MCTISWLIKDDDYHVFFNRDEQRSRANAAPPRVMNIKDTQTLIPIDPVGNGSWISTNEFGLTLCLLNYYQGSTPKSVLTSRGLLLKDLSSFLSVEDIDIQLKNLNLHKYASFSLLAFGLNDCGGVSKQAWQWNGKKLTNIFLTSPFTSSSVNFDEVSQSRLLLAQQLLEPISVDALVNYHKSHQPTKGYLSVCMHREDAKTVSFSHIHVDTIQSIFKYKNASPCSEVKSDIMMLQRRMKNKVSNLNNYTKNT
ncbi:NRDE family protein [Arcobacteraceae bacterium]|nr:NRDE family protein [Arcobacteraceae bacterium]